jgi:hypothetical protein
MQQIKGFRLYGWSVVVAMGMMMLIGGIASIPGCDLVWDALLPGAFLAAVVFPQGINSAGGNAYLVVAGLLDALLFALPVMFCWQLAARRKSPTREKL